MNCADYFVDRHIREGRSNKVAFREVHGDNREITYGQLASDSDFSGAAFSNAGISPHQRAAMFVLDQIEFPVIFWGAIKAAIEPVALNTLLATDVYRNIIDDCGASIVFVSAELLDVVLPACEEVQKIVVIGGDAPAGTISYDEFMSGDLAPVSTVKCSNDDVAFWLYSSGSTGRPKGVRHKHGSMQYTCETYGQQLLNIREDDLVFSAAKLFFAYGLGNGMSFPMSVGATSLLYNARPTPDSVTDILKKYKPTIYYGVPTLYAALVHKWEADSAPEVPLRRCVSAGEALPAEIGKKWQALTGVDIIDGVGSTEMLHIFLSNAPDSVVYGTSGVPVPGYEVRLIDENGTDVAAGELGEMIVRGGSSALDYWNQKEKSAVTFDGEWTHTGDKYEMADNGRYIYCGRTDDMFKVSGIWVSPFEVEQALIEHPAILEGAVVAHKDEDDLEKPKAFVVLKEGHGADSLNDLSDFVKERIGKWKYPRWVEVVDDLPKTATGKIQRFKLRAPA